MCLSPRNTIYTLLTQKPHRFAWAFVVNSKLLQKRWSTNGVHCRNGMRWTLYFLHSFLLRSHLWYKKSVHWETIYKSSVCGAITLRWLCVWPMLNSLRFCHTFAVVRFHLAGKLFASWPRQPGPIDCYLAVGTLLDFRHTPLPCNPAYGTLPRCISNSLLRWRCFRKWPSHSISVERAANDRAVATNPAYCMWPIGPATRRPPCFCLLSLCCSLQAATQLSSWKTLLGWHALFSQVHRRVALGSLQVQWSSRDSRATVFHTFRPFCCVTKCPLAACLALAPTHSFGPMRSFWYSSHRAGKLDEWNPSRPLGFPIAPMQPLTLRPEISPFQSIGRKRICSKCPLMNMNDHEMWVIHLRFVCVGSKVCWHSIECCQT